MTVAGKARGCAGEWRQVYFCIRMPSTARSAGSVQGQQDDAPSACVFGWGIFNFHHHGNECLYCMRSLDRSSNREREINNERDRV